VDGVTGSAQIGLQADGKVSFRGTVTNPAAGGINYLFAVVLLDVKDSSGNARMYANTGGMFNAVQGSSSSWQQDGFDPLIANNWDAAKKSRVHTILQDSDSPFDDIVAVATSVLGVAGIVVGLILLLLLGGGYSCDWLPGDGGLVRCEQ
jgi:hypothetical protein